MKTICGQQHLHLINGGSATAYSWVTGTTSTVGTAVGGFIGFALAVGGRRPNLLALVTLPVVGGFAGAVGGYTVGAVSYTVGNNLEAILSAPFKVINFVFQPSN